MAHYLKRITTHGLRLSGPHPNKPGAGSALFYWVPSPRRGLVPHVDSKLDGQPGDCPSSYECTAEDENRPRTCLWCPLPPEDSCAACAIEHGVNPYLLLP